MTPQPPSVRDRAAADKPSEPGWYECRHRNDPAQRLARWWDGRFLSENPPRHSCNLSIEVGDYTDFLGPLVRDDEIERLRAFKQLVHARLSQVGVPFFDDGRECRIEARLEWLFKKMKLSTQEERSVENG